MTILVLAEHNNKQIKSSTYNTITAASKISDDIHVAVTGWQNNDVIDNIAKIPTIKKVIQIEGDIFANLLAENVAEAIVDIADNYSHILAPATSFGKNIMPRISALLDISQISDIIDIKDNNTFVRPIYAGNALATIYSNDTKKIITVRATSFIACKKDGGSANIEKITVENKNICSQFIKREESLSDRPQLDTAKIVVSGGRALKSQENFEMINALADKLNAAIGASRAAVDAGYIGNDYQVGQTGKIISPDLYIAVGISGAIQHLAGMKESKVIVAINNDADAPIFNIADYGLCADLFEAIPQLLENI